MVEDDGHNSHHSESLDIGPEGRLGRLFGCNRTAESWGSQGSTLQFCEQSPRYKGKRVGSISFSWESEGAKQPPLVCSPLPANSALPSLRFPRPRWESSASVVDSGGRRGLAAGPDQVDRSDRADAHGRPLPIGAARARDRRTPGSAEETFGTSRRSSWGPVKPLGVRLKRAARSAVTSVLGLRTLFCHRVARSGPDPDRPLISGHGRAGDSPYDRDHTSTRFLPRTGLSATAHMLCLSRRELGPEGRVINTGLTAPRLPNEKAQPHVVAAIVVTYNSAVGSLQQLVAQLGDAVAIVVVADNSDTESTRRVIFAESALIGATYIGGMGNTGIGRAQNAAIDEAVRRGASQILLLDDDSLMDSDTVKALSRSLHEARMSDRCVAAVGPVPIDVRTGDALVFIWRGSRVRSGSVVPTTKGPAAPAFQDVAFLVSSGSMIDPAAFTEIGQFREDYFIDHVDKEWGLRAGLDGWRLLVDRRTVLSHTLGDEAAEGDAKTLRYGHADPDRTYYNVRNSLLLLRDLPLPRRRFLCEAADALYLAGLHYWRSEPAGRRAVAAAIRDAVRNRRGVRQAGAA